MKLRVERAFPLLWVRSRARELPGKLTALSFRPSCSPLLSLAPPCIAWSILLCPEGEETGRFKGKRYLLFFSHDLELFHLLQQLVLL